jgi:hypothetical protein
MEKKYILGIIIVIVLVLISAYFLVSNSAILYKSPEKNPGNCKVIQFNGYKGINIIFFATKIQAEEYSEFFLNITPFSSNKKSFNFYYINDYTPGCEIYKDSAVLCYSEDMIKRASSCPDGYIVAITDKAAQIRSSSYMNVLSLNSNHPLTVFPHEFGHAFAFLAEEYVPAELPAKSKNCQSSCEKFGNISCFLGCSKENYYRSIENGIMRTLTSNKYGLFDENLILSKIPATSAITGNAIQDQQDCSSQKYYLIKGDYSRGNIKITKECVETGCVSSEGSGDFEYTVINQDNSTSTNEFNPELIFTDAQNGDEISGHVYENDGPFILKLPVNDNSKTLEISKENKTLAEINLFDSTSIPCPQ